MEITAQQLWDRLQQSGLASAATCHSWANSISLSVGAANLEDARKIASELIRTRKLTPYQCNTLFEQSAPLLRIGNYEVVDSLADSLGANWIEVRDQRKSIESKSASSHSTYWAFLLSPAGLKNPIVKHFPPSLQLAKQHLALQALGVPPKDTVGPNDPSNQSGWALDQWGEIQTLDGSVLASCAPIPGVSLKQLLASNGPLTLERTIAIVRNVAEALKRQHSAGITHGSLAARSISVLAEDNVVLRRDILFPPNSPYFDRSVSMLNLGALERYAIAAPELSIQNVKPSPATDLYAPGILWGTMLQGRLPWSQFESFDIPAWRETHRVRPVELRSGIPEPIVNCIRHLTGKNPDSRFANIDQFLKALGNITRPATNGVEKHRESIREEISVPTPVPQVAEEFEDFFQPTKPVIAGGRKKGRGQIAAPLKSAEHSTTGSKTDGKAGNATVPRRSKWILPASILGGVFIVGGIGIWALRSGSSSALSNSSSVSSSVDGSSTMGSVAPGPNSSGATGATGGLAPTGEAARLLSQDPGLSERFEVQDDPGAHLWLPPQSPDPIRLDLLPMGCELLLAFNGEAWTNSSNKYTDLIPWVEESLPQWQAFSKKFQITERVQKTQPNELLVALYPDTINDSYEGVLRLQFDAPKSIDSLLSDLEGYAVQNFPEGDQTGIFVNDEMAVAFEGTKVAGSESVQYMILGPAALLKTLVETGGGAPSLRRQLDVLLQNSNRKSDLYLLATPAFLKGNARSLLEIAPQLSGATDALLSERVQAISYSGRLEGQWYSELRLVLTNAATLQQTRNELKQRLEQLPEALEKHFADAPPASYWSVLAMRYPFMLRSVGKNVRWGIEDGQLIANAYLPNASLSNLVVATWMSLQDSAIGSESNSELVPQVTLSSGESLDQLLDRPISIAFAQESLDMALAAIGTEFNESIMKGAGAIEFVINGAAFQKEGITQNMQIRDFDQASKPLREVLTALVRRANPVTTVQSPTEKDQKVVWVLREDASTPGKQRIELTTRTWATENQIVLPAVFIAP